MAWGADGTSACSKAIRVSVQRLWAVLVQEALGRQAQVCSVQSLVTLLRMISTSDESVGAVQRLGFQDSPGVPFVRSVERV